MLAHLAMEYRVKLHRGWSLWILERPDDLRPSGARWQARYLDPSKPENWVADPCTFCGGESHSAVCPGDGRPHRHGAIHLPSGFKVNGKEVTGFGYLCRSPECIARAHAAWGEQHAAYLAEQLDARDNRI